MVSQQVASILTFLISLHSVIVIEAHRPYSHCNSPQCEVRLRTDAGWVCGRVRLAEDNTQYASFRGVPYAKPPVGERRFKELEPLEPWSGLLDATEDGPACPQKDFIYNRLVQHRRGMSEDCIQLNLHVPLNVLLVGNSRNTPGLSILVFVHGGAFQAGSSLTDLHGPEYLMRQNIIAITFNMRIGLFGFLSLNNEHIPGNQGLRDVITLLRWVQRNARAFGGNPDDVTLMGHSTGGVIAHLISLSQASTGLIHKVVLMSGNALVNTMNMSPAHAEYMAKKILHELGIDSNDPVYIHNRLITEPLLNIMDACSRVQLTADVDFLTFTPVIETSFPNVTTVINDDPIKLMRMGRGKQYPLLVGFTDAEYYYFKWNVLAANPMEKIKTKPRMALPVSIRTQYSMERQLEAAKTINKKYSLEGGTLEQYLDYLSDMIFIYPTVKTAEIKMKQEGPVYLYQFSYEAERSVIKEALWSKYRGVAHVEDLTYVFKSNAMLFDHKSYPPKNKDDLMREWMPLLIANFVKCSNPTCSKNESLWSRLSADNFRYQNIAEPMVYKMQCLTPRQSDMKNFFDGLLPATFNVQGASNETRTR